MRVIISISILVATKENLKKNCQSQYPKINDILQRFHSVDGKAAQ